MSVAEVSLPKVSEKTQVFHHILAATDFSQHSRRALAVAFALAQKNEARLSVAHVLPPDWRYDILDTPPETDLAQRDCEQRLEAFTAEFHANAPALDSILIKHGPVVPGILSTIAEAGVDLLVMGTHGRHGLAKLAMGSVAEELVRRAPCPVLTIGPKARIEAGPHLRTILFATDFGKGSSNALPLALGLARLTHAKLILLHMIAPMPASSNLSAYGPASSVADEITNWEASSRKHAVEQLERCLPTKTGLDCPPQYLVGMEMLPEGILTAAERFDADLIVMGANQNGSPHMAAHIPWTAVHEVLRNAPCPVLTVAG